MKTNTIIHKIILFVGFAFIYIPIIALIAYSFNASKIVAVWDGFSTRWYRVLFTDHELINAVLFSIKIAVSCGILSVILGTFAGFVLTRIGRFPGRGLFAGMLTAPIVMPDVITGVSLLLLFISMQQIIGFPSERGFLTILIGHATICMCYVAISVFARLLDVNRNLEYAAMDLGASPIKVFCLITIPLIFPAIVAGFLLSITLSLDDFVVASFLSGNGSMTLSQIIFARIRFGLNPEINAIGTIIILLVGIMVILANYFIMNYERRKYTYHA